MMKKMRKDGLRAMMLVGLLLSGCATDYSFRAKVPEGLRTVSVPTFRNESMLVELGPVVTRQVLREFQREGTFAVRPAGEAALEIQGEIEGASFDISSYNRRSGLRGSGGMFTLSAKVSVIDKREGRVLVNDRAYTAQVPLASLQDLYTAQRDASGRVADDLARQIVEDILNLKW